LTVFADTSAVVKIYCDEPGSVRMRRLDWMIVSELVLVELPAAFWRKVRMGQLSRRNARIMIELFFQEYSLDEDVSKYLPVRVDERLFRRAADLVEEHGLRAYDAAQLASAVEVRGLDDSVDMMFACADVQLARAAGKAGFTILDLAE
jgi:predicted nucleic acid-binding protein